MRRLLFLLPLLIHGCLSIPEQNVESVAFTSGLDDDFQAAMDSGIFVAKDWPPADWWLEYDDAFLNELIDVALEKSPTLRLAEERLNAAANVTIEKRAALFPELAIDGNDNYEHFSKHGFFRTLAPTVPAVINDITLNLSYRWEIDFWGKNRNTFQASLGELRAAEADRDAAKLILTTSIAYDYAELQFLLRKKEILMQKNAHDQALLKIRENRHRQALDTALQVLSAEANVLDTAVLLAELDQQIEQHLHELKALSGMGQGASLQIPQKALKQAVVTLPETLSLDLIARRPELAAQRERVEAAAKLIGAAKADFYPSINLLGFAGLESLHWQDLFKRGSFNGSFEPAFHLPIFTAGRIRAQLKEKVSEFNQAVDHYNELILTAAQDVADRLTTMIQIQKEISLRESSLQVARKQEALTRRRFDHAIADQVTYLEIQNHLLDVELVYTALEYSKHLANILLIRSLGGGMHE